MKILWITSKDVDNPLAGGVEAVNQELIKRLAHNGHHVILLTAGFEGAKTQEMKDGYRIIRVGNRWSVYYRAYHYYRQQLRGWPDLVIDEVSSLPFFAKRYVEEKNILFIHHLTREIWFYQLPFPLSLLGYLLEPVYVRALAGIKTVTVSESTKADLCRFRFLPDDISVISEGIQILPIKDLHLNQKYSLPTMLSIGTIREIKRTDHIVRAFLIAKEQIPDLHLIIVGSQKGRYGRRVRGMVKESGYQSSVTFAGKVSEEEKIELLRKAHVLVMASVKEGWGIAVTEANSQGTPAIAYDVDGLRDSIRHGKTGLLAKNDDPAELANAAVMLLKDPEEYERLRQEAWEWSKSITFDRSFQDFSQVISAIMGIESVNGHAGAISLFQEDIDTKQFLHSPDEENAIPTLDKKSLSDNQQSFVEVPEMLEHLPQGSWGDQFEPPHHAEGHEENMKESLLLKSGWRNFRSPSFLRPKIVRKENDISTLGLRRSEPIRIPTGEKT